MAEATSSPVPQDEFSLMFREYRDHPQAIRSASTVNRSDFYGNTETWVVETMRAEGKEVVFLIRSNAGGGQRIVLPPEVTAAIGRQRDQVIARARKRAANKGAATRKAAKQKAGK
jgi:hypothetical protein